MIKKINFITGLLILLMLAYVAVNLIQSVYWDTMDLVSTTKEEQLLVEEKNGTTEITDDDPVSAKEDTLDDLYEKPLYPEDGINSVKIIEATDAGLAEKKIKALEEASKNNAKVTVPNTKKSKASTDGDYLVIAGSFTKAINANQEVRRLKKMGFTQAEAVYLGNTKYLSIIVGRGTTEVAANTLVAQLKKKGVNAYVQKRKG